jgi:hypothetical protein
MAGGRHPCLESALVVSLRSFSLQWREYSRSANPPLLHRKEEFVAAHEQLRAKHASLRAQKERAGLFGGPTTIGTRMGWQRALDSAGVRLRGHGVIRSRPAGSLDGAR